ncbi:hypothetical protein DRQ09_07580 [candidate division KSB1 bacterium]|nr:MAG: hypothetical protein DRQ09_07580 [candidate division KSB1 bacterium]
MILLAEKLQLERGGVVHNPELIKQAFLLLRTFEKLDRRKKPAQKFDSPIRERRDLRTNERVLEIIKRLKNLEEDLIAKKNPLSIENIKSTMRAVMEGKKGSFTGRLKIGFEDNKIVLVELIPLETEEDLSEIIIQKDRFQDILKAIDHPEEATEEELKMAEGIEREKIIKAIELDAEQIIKTPFLKIDGTINYKITATLKE